VERVLAAFLVSPMAGVALITAFVWLTVRVPDLKLLIGVCLLHYPIALVPGIPGYFLLRRLGLLRRAHWTLLFSTTSGALSAILALLFRVPHAPGAVGIVGTATPDKLAFFEGRPRCHKCCNAPCASITIKQDFGSG